MRKIYLPKTKQKKPQQNTHHDVSLYANIVLAPVLEFLYTHGRPQQKYMAILRGINMNN